MLQVYDDNYFMRKALDEAQLAAESGEVPVGAVIVCNNHIIAKAHNQVETLNDITAHAEILAITAASNYLGNKFLDDCTLYVTLEPCPMCAGALKWSRIQRIVYGASDDKGGFMRYGKKMLHPQSKLEFGVMHEECGAILSAFFQARRIKI
ncbi:MAG: nucleoside deaminase [Saprospiraceae bacterium]|nr:nucleoside deaminase [Saprospiraceae bacterium]